MIHSIDRLVENFHIQEPFQPLDNRNGILGQQQAEQRAEHLELRDRQDATSRFLLAALVLNNDNVLGTIRRELRRVVDVLVDEDVIAKVLKDEVIKRDTLEGPAAEEAAKRLKIDLGMDGILVEPVIRKS